MQLTLSAARFINGRQLEESMPIERETIIAQPARADTVVVGSGGSPFPVIGGIVAALVVVALIIWAMNGGISGGNGTVNVDLPEVTVTQ
jgi:hypothetical protein